MAFKEVIRTATEIVEQLPLDLLQKNNIVVDRVHDNPEAARYFLMFADWDKLSSEDIFSKLDPATAKKHRFMWICPFAVSFVIFALSMV